MAHQKIELRIWQKKILKSLWLIKRGEYELFMLSVAVLFMYPIIQVELSRGIFIFHDLFF